MRAPVAPGARPPAGRPCVFCGGRPLTYEDTWPIWLLKLTFPRGTPANVRRGPPQALTGYATVGPKARARLVCKGCNNGWMSALEVVVAPSLSTALAGSLPDLDFQEQQILSTWAVKTAAMLERTQTRDQQFLVPPAVFAQLYVRKTAPPDLTYVWLGVDDLDAGLAFGIRPMGVEVRRLGRLAAERTAVLGYEARLLVGKARLLVLGVPAEPGPNFHENLAPNAEFISRRIWPPEQSRGVLLP